jgi:hypothetical protein
MKFERRDFTKLQWYAVLAIVAIAIAIAAGWWSLGGANKARSERDAAAQQKTQIEQRLGQVRTEEQDIKARTLQFQQMELAGIVGPEKRLDWTELLRDIQRQLRLPGMTYEFGPQILLESGPVVGYAFHSSQLKIQLRLLHEGDLLNFITHLQRDAKAMVLVRNCKVSRLSGGQQTDGAQLLGECTMEWVTLRQTSGTKQP